jgi:ribosomal protein S18 acetylase RimI-like enzyme
VARRARRRGHARTLLLSLFAAFRAGGLREAELSVAGTNASASGLFVSAGMTPDFTAERWELGDPASAA